MKQDLTGQQYGYLTVLGKADTPGKKRRYWLCRCRCGNEKIVEESHLKSGHTKSCGCYRREKQRERWLDLKGQRYGRLVALRPVEETGKQTERWECICDCGKRCVVSKINLRSGITKSCGCLQAEQRKKNMRKAIHFADGTCVERISSKTLSFSNTTGHRGVYSRGNGRFRAAIGFQGKIHYLGTYGTYEDAVNARLEAEKRLYDPFLEEYRKKMQEGERMAPREETDSRQENDETKE